MTILELTKQLVRIPSVTSDQAQCKLVLETIEHLFTSKVFIIERFEQAGIHSLIVKNFDGEWADVCFNGHIDVVPPQSDDQREPTEREGMLWGRGCGDMKDGIALVSLLMKELCEQQTVTKKMMLLITADEEIGGKNGVEYLTSLWYGGDIVLIPDGGNRHEIVIWEKWVINLTLTATGKAGHSSRPWKYENAIEKLYLAYTNIKERIETAELHIAPDHRGCSVQLTTISWGQASNMIPWTASGTLNIRYTEKTSFERIMRNIEEILWWIGNVAVSVQMEAGVLFTDPTHRIIKQYHRIAEKHLGDVALTKEHGASDGRFFAEKGATVILQKPSCFDIHWPEERTTIADMDAIYEVYKEFVLSV
jgi:succinyl-diaminopimelate desuccinylase